MTGKRWKKWITMAAAAGMLVSQLGTQPVWAAEMTDAEMVAEILEETLEETEPESEAVEESTAEASEEETEAEAEAAEESTAETPEEETESESEAVDESTMEIPEEETEAEAEEAAPESAEAEIAFDEVIFQPNDAVKQLDDYTSITYEDCRGTGKKGEWRLYNVNDKGEYIDKNGNPIKVKKGDGKWHMYVWFAPDCEEDLQYLLGLRSFLPKCDMDNLEVTLFWWRGADEEMLKKYALPESVCAVSLSHPCPSEPDDRFTASTYLTHALNAVAADYGLAEKWEDTNTACPSGKNEIMVFVENPEGKFSRFSYGFPRAGTPWMTSSESAFLFEDRLISIAVSIISLEKENFPYPSAYDEYPPAPKPAPGSISPVKFNVVGVIGGRNVTFSSDTKDAVIYYSSTTSTLTTGDACVRNGETVLFEDFYGTIYARAYVNGVWGNVSRLILKIPVVNKPVITCKDGLVTIRTSTPDSYIYYTTDGSIPSPTNGTKLSKSAGSFMAPPNCTVNAIAVRSCFTNSEVASVSVPNRKVGAPAFTVMGVFGGREVTFNSAESEGEIYYSFTTSNITTADNHVKIGETVLFQNYYGTVYAKTYVNGQWSNVSRLILKIPVVNKPNVTLLENGRIKISTSTPNSYIFYTTDGSYPSLTNGRMINASSGIVTVGNASIVKAIAVRSCFTNSPVVEQSLFYWFY